MRKTSYKAILLAAAAAMAVAASSPAQTAPASSSNSNTGNSLGAAARNLKGQSASSTKRVFTNDDMEATNEPLPLPRLNLNINQPDNSAEIVAAILAYRQNHSLKQTEDTVHEWFDYYDRSLADAVQGLNDHESARQTSAKAWHEPCPTGEFKADCEKEHQKEVLNMMKSDPVINKDNRTIGRIQSGLKNVRDALVWKNNIRYSWFTIRSSNGYDTF